MNSRENTAWNVLLLGSKGGSLRKLKCCLVECVFDHLFYAERYKKGFVMITKSHFNHLILNHLIS